MNITNEDLQAIEKTIAFTKDLAEGRVTYKDYERAVERGLVDQIQIA
ncbi:hypothetical protein [Pseudoalteromonas rubra]|nr:hypothetical protein [Pseudoalteromonas rubra]